MTTTTQAIPDRSSPGSTRAAPAASNQGRGGKLTTGNQTGMRIRNNTVIGTWNVRTLSATGKLYELVHELKRYQWQIIGISEMRWKDNGELRTEDGHKVYYSGPTDKHEHGVGFIINNMITNTVMGCQAVSSRIITIRMKATPFNVTIIQVYAPTTDYTDEEVEEFYDLLQNVIDRVEKKDILIVQGDWNAKVGEDANTVWNGTCGTSCNVKTNDRGLRLLEFASSNDLILANTFGTHKPSRKWTWHSPNHEHHNQIDYIMIRKRFRSSVNFPQTRSFPAADIGIDHDLVMMTFRLRLKRVQQQTFKRMKYNLERLTSPGIIQQFNAVIGGKFHQLVDLNDTDVDVDKLTDTFNTVMSDTAAEVLGKGCSKKQSWITDEILALCDERRKLRKHMKETHSVADEYRKCNKTIRKAMKAAKEQWIDDKCTAIEDNLTRHNSKEAYKVVKDLTTDRKSNVSTIQDKRGNCLTEEDKIMKRWTEYCTELYNHPVTGDTTVLKVFNENQETPLPILRSEIETAVNSLKKGKSPGVDNIPAELILAGDNKVIDVLTTICNSIWKNGKWPTPWTQSLVITLPKRGNLQLCQNYRTISLISHPSKVMLKVIQNRLKPQAEAIIAE